MIFFVDTVRVALFQDTLTAHFIKDLLLTTKDDQIRACMRDTLQPLLQDPRTFSHIYDLTNSMLSECMDMEDYEDVGAGETQKEFFQLACGICVLPSWRKDGLKKGRSYLEGFQDEGGEAGSLVTTMVARHRIYTFVVSHYRRKQARKRAENERVALKDIQKQFKMLLAMRHVKRLKYATYLQSLYRRKKVQKQYIRFRRAWKKVITQIAKDTSKTWTEIKFDYDLEPQEELDESMQQILDERKKMDELMNQEAQASKITPVITIVIIQNGVPSGFEM